MIPFEKGNRCCRFVFKCECGSCFEVIYDLERNCCHKRKCCCCDKKDTIKVKFYCVNMDCHKKKIVVITVTIITVIIIVLIGISVVSVDKKYKMILSYNSFT